MLRSLILVVGIGAIVLGCVGAQAAIVEGEPRVEVWTDRGTGGVYRVGEDVEICFRADRDCYVIIYDIDTDGHLRLLFPYYCGDDGYVEGGSVYSLGRGYYGPYYISGPTGVEYVHALASLRPFRTLYWHGCDGYEAYAYDVSWQGFSDYWGCALPERIYGDPYMAMQSINEFICYDALDAGLAFADFTYFYIDKPVSYPRYVCYDCHGFGTYYRPYVHTCTGFSITFIDCDPCWNPWSWWWWCTPRRVYCGPRYVCCAKRECKGWPSEYKWKSRSDCYTDRSDYAHYWDERVRVKTSHVEDAGQERGKTKERDLYVREPRRVESGQEPRRLEAHRDATVRDGRIDVIRPVEVQRYETEKVEKARVPVDVGERDRREIVPQPRSIEKKQIKVEKAPKEVEKSSPKRVVPKPETQSKKVEVRKETRPASQTEKARKVQIKTSTSGTSSGNKKVAPKVRTGSSKGRSPSKRRSISS
jgi:hypothetical protein